MTSDRFGAFLPGVPAAVARALEELRRRIAATDSAVDTINSTAGFIERASFTPTLVGLAVGTGGSATNSGSYTWVGGSGVGDHGHLYANGVIQFGTSGQTFPGATIVITLPSGFEMPVNNYASGTHAIPGGVTFADPGVTNWHGSMWRNSATQVRALLINVGAGTYPYYTQTGTTAPFTWAAGDAIFWSYMVAAQRT